MQRANANKMSIAADMKTCVRIKYAHNANANRNEKIS